MNAKALSKNGEKSKRDTIILYKGVWNSLGMNADFVMKAGNHNTSAITTTAICCDMLLCLKKFSIILEIHQIETDVVTIVNAFKLNLFYILISLSSCFFYILSVSCHCDDTTA